MFFGGCRSWCDTVKQLRLFVGRMLLPSVLRPSGGAFQGRVAMTIVKSLRRQMFDAGQHVNWLFEFALSECFGGDT